MTASDTFDYTSESVLGGSAQRRDHEGTEQDSNTVRDVAESSLQRRVVREFVDFYLSQASTDLVTSVGYVPVSTATVEANRRRFDEVV
jgi:ABC-type phosphate transport system substrate-binding protein